jgi:membrane protease YdiL (CAAX protease family)
MRKWLLRQFFSFIVWVIAVALLLAAFTFLPNLGKWLNPTDRTQFVMHSAILLLGVVLVARLIARLFWSRPKSADDL